MKLSTFSASFHEYEYDLDYYHGKDIVHEGSLLKIDPDYSWNRISSKIRNKIRQAQKLEVDIKKVRGTAQDIKDFRTVWFDPADETIPEKLGKDEVMYMAYIQGELVGGLILTPSSPSVLYMHNLGSNDSGKRQNIPALLLWNAVEDLQGTKWEYIDVGVSFRPTLNSFFKSWKADSYPIIFSPPFIRPDIRITPFTASDMITYREDTQRDAYRIVEEHFGKNYTILPRAISCLQAILKHIGVTKNDTVAVYKTFEDNEYISGCVSGPIEQVSKMVRVIDADTKAVIVIHEFGFPYKDIFALKKICEQKGIPLIEDCAWSYSSRFDDSKKVGDVGDYAIYSLPKIFPMQYGGILTGLSIPDDKNWADYKLLDYFKREVIIHALAHYLPKLDQDAERRRQNWIKLEALFRRDGYDTMVKLEENVYPGSFLVSMSNFQEVFERYEKFGVEAGRYYPERALFLPVHQGLGDAELDYIYGVFRGLLNLSSNYSRGGKK